MAFLFNVNCISFKTFQDDTKTPTKSDLHLFYVISMIRKNQLPRLWSTVSDQVLEDIELDVSDITLSVQNLDDLRYLFTEVAARNISKLR